jgi:putative MATE family efflux protein
MKNEIDMLEGSLGRNIFRFALPLAVTGILQQLFNAADIVVVGRFVGKNAMAAVGSNAPLINLLVTFFVGISLGANVVMAQFAGSHDVKRIQQAVHTSVLIAIAGGILVTTIGELAVDPVLRLLSVPDEVMGMSVTYLRIYLIGLPVIMLYNFEAAISRSQGDSRTPLICLAVSGIINVCLNLFFVCIVGMTASGVALATVIANLLSSVMMFLFLRRGPEATRIYIRQVRLHRDVLKKILYIGIPSGIQGMMFSLANIIVQSAINSLGATIMAASAAAFNIEVIAWFIINSFGQACMTFAGQNYGAGRSERCKKVLRTSILEDIVFTLAACGLILLFGKEILGLFNKDPGVINNGYLRLLTVFSAYAFTLIIENVSGYMRGFGLSMVPALTAMLCICGVRLLWVFFVFPDHPTFYTVMVVYPISLAINALAVSLACLILHPSRKKYRL